MRQGTLSLNIENFELNSLFDVLVKGRKTFEMKQQTLTIEPTAAIVKADKALTLFMINTLTENARKYTQPGGNVSVYAQETESYVEISVKDDGPGLSQEDVERILSEKVYDSGKIGLQTSENVSELQKNKGHGFGLMNCKGIIDKYKKTNEIFRVCLFGRGRYNYCSRGCMDSDPSRNAKIQEKRKLAQIDYSAVHKKAVATKNIVGEDGLTTHERTGVARKKRLIDNPELVDEFVSRMVLCHKTATEDERKRRREKRVDTMVRRHGRAHFGGGYSPLKRITVADKEFIVQGYEDVFVQTHEDTSHLICCNQRKEYAFVYEFNGNKYTYYPDFFDSSKNVFFEIKSKYWWEREIDRNLAKIESVRHTGRNIEVVIYDGKEIDRIRKEIERRDRRNRETNI
jgi:hypothetical protein